MLTPIDIQSKTFKGGFGYDRKEVDSFVAEVVENYEHIYRENTKQLKNLYRRHFFWLRRLLMIFRSRHRKKHVSSKMMHVIERT